MTDDRFEKLGKAIDRVDNCAHSLRLPMPDSLHVKVLRDLLPEIVAELKIGYTEAVGENPWAEEGGDDEQL